jgi:hypothetical protein
MAIPLLAWAFVADLDKQLHKIQETPNALPLPDVVTGLSNFGCPCQDHWLDMSDAVLVDVSSDILPRTFPAPCVNDGRSGLADSCVSSGDPLDVTDQTCLDPGSPVVAKIFLLFRSQQGKSHP